MASTADSATVLVAGRRQITLPASPEAFEPEILEAATYTIDCASGDRETGEWRGVPLETVLERADAGPDATHLLVTGSDGYRVCLPLVEALDALIALERCDRPADADSLPRFIGAGLEGTRSVRGVARLDTVALGPDEDPELYEASSASDA